MRHLIMFSLLILLLVAVQFSKAQSVDEIINHHLDALGGKEKLLTLKTVKMEASMNMQGMDIGIVTTIANGIGSRVDISVPGMGEGYQILGKEKGWNFMPFQGQTSPEESPAEDVKFSQTTLDIQSPLLNYKEKGHTVELLGKETVDKVECYKIKLTAKTGKMVTYFIDTKTYMKVKTLGKAKPGDAEEMEISYTDFKKNGDGYTFPYSQTSARGTLNFSTIETNKPVDEKIFSAN